MLRTRRSALEARCRHPACFLSCWPWAGWRGACLIRPDRRPGPSTRRARSMPPGRFMWRHRHGSMCRRDRHPSGIMPRRRVGLRRRRAAGGDRVRRRLARRRTVNRHMVAMRRRAGRHPRDPASRSAVPHRMTSNLGRMRRTPPDTEFTPARLVPHHGPHRSSGRAGARGLARVPTMRFLPHGLLLTGAVLLAGCVQYPNGTWGPPPAPQPVAYAAPIPAPSPPVVYSPPAYGYGYAPGVPVYVAPAPAPPPVVVAPSVSLGFGWGWGRGYWGGGGYWGRPWYGRRW